MAKQPINTPVVPTYKNPHRAESFNGGQDAEIPRIPQFNTREVTAVIWKKSDGKASIGHAAICLRRSEDQRPSFKKQTDQRWVSWIPGSGEANINDVRKGMFQETYADSMVFETSLNARVNLNDDHVNYIPRPDQKVVGSDGPKTKQGEIAYNEVWGTTADKFVHMPAFGQYFIGIDMDRIIKWCYGFIESPNSFYDLVSNTNNCSSVAWHALDAGGGKAFCKIQGAFPNHLTYTTPSEFHDYCVNVEQGIRTIKRDYETIESQFRLKMINNAYNLALAAPKGFAHGQHDIYNYRDWMQESDVAWKIRGFTLRRIDNAIENYHKLSWVDNYPEKLYELLVIIHNLAEHLLKSESGKRDAAICALSKHVIDVVEVMRKKALQAWDPRDYYGKARGDNNFQKRQGSRNPFQVIAEGFRGLIK